MPRIDDRTWEYTPEEQIIAEIVDLLTDQGMPQGDAVILIRGSRVPEGLRSNAEPGPGADPGVHGVADGVADARSRERVSGASKRKRIDVRRKPRGRPRRSLGTTRSLPRYRRPSVVRGCAPRTRPVITSLFTRYPRATHRGSEDVRLKA
jgi:hypothetical protein